MKNKIISFIIVVLLLVPCLCLTATAQNSDIAILNGGQNLQYKGEQYIRFDASLVYFDTEDYFEDVKYDNIDIKSANYDISKNDIMITAFFNYRDGSTLTANFIRQDYQNEYLSFLESNDNYIIDFSFPEYATVTTTKNKLQGEKVTLQENQLIFCDDFNVEIQSPNNIYSVTMGSLLIVNDEYYYVDFKETDIINPYDFFPSEMQSLEAYKITDADLCQQIKSTYTNSDFNLLGGNFFSKVSTVFVAFIFVVLPLAVLVLFLILSLRAKAPVYKKLFHTIWITASVELVAVAVVVVILLVFN